MGKFLKKFKSRSEDTIKNISHNVDKIKNSHKNGRIQDQREENMVGTGFGDEDFKEDSDFNDNGEYPIPASQQPESFFHFILENKFRDLERSIRGLKDVWSKEQNKFITKKKELHCFTDEEAEQILRAAQNHLSTDIKLSHIRKDSFAIMIDAIYSQMSMLFFSIADYEYGRYGSMENQYKMKRENLKIFLELMTRIQANYSMAIEGKENTATHGNIRVQESLQSGERDVSGQKYGY